MSEYGNKFCWLVRVSSIGKYKELRDYLYAWNTKNRVFVTFDDIKVIRVSRLGWFQNLHLDLQKPLEFKTYLEEKLLALGHTIEYDLFKKKVVSNARDNK